MWAVEKLESAASGLDVVTMELHRGLARMEEEVNAATDDDTLSYWYWAQLELFQSLRNLGVWLLTFLVRALSPQRLSSVELWAWAGDPLAIFVLTKGLLTYSADRWAEGLPRDLAHVQEVLLEATLGLGDAHVAFSSEADQDAFEQNAVGMDVRNVALAAHRASLCQALAAAELLPLCCQQLRRAPRRSGPVLQLGRFLAHLAPHDHDGALHRATATTGVWEVLAGAVAGDELSMPQFRSHLEACRAITSLAQITPGALDTLMGPALAMACDDANILAMVAALAVAAGRAPSAEPGLSAAISGLQGDPATSAAKWMWRFNVGLEDSQQAYLLAEWRGLLPATEEDRYGQTSLIWAANEGHHETVTERPPPEVEPQVAAAAAATAAARPDMRALIAEVPQQFRCALDGKLLADPVRSPQGYLFERGALQRHLAAHGTCPITGSPLQLEACPRAAEVRRELLAWVRSQSQRGRSKQR